MEKPIWGEEIEIDQELYEEVCIEAAKRNWTPEELVQAALIWMLESAREGARNDVE